MTAVIYARYSSHNQTEQSIEGQITECRKYALSRELSITEIYADRAISGKTDNRPAFQRMMQDAKAKKFKHVIVYKTDRFSRDRADAIIYKSILKKNGITLHYAAEQIPEGASGIILESVLEAMAEHYSRELAEKVNRGLNESAKKCQSCGGIVPFGYLTNKEKAFTIDEQNAPIVKAIYRMFDEGYGKAEILKHLNDRGILPSVRSKEFTYNALQTVLSNRRYTGVYMYKDIAIEGGMPQIIEKDLFDRVQLKLQETRSTTPRRKQKGVSTMYLLTGKIACGDCGRPYTGVSGTSNNGTKHCYYACNGQYKDKSCTAKALPKDALESAVLKSIFENVLNPDKADQIAQSCIEQYQKEKNADGERNALIAQLTDVQTKKANIMKAIEGGMINPDFNARYNQLCAQETALHEDLLKETVIDELITEEHIKYMLSQFYTTQPPTQETKERILRSFVNNILVYPDTIAITFNVANKEKTALESAEISKFLLTSNWSTTPHLTRTIHFHLGYLLLLLPNPQKSIR